MATHGGARQGAGRRARTKREDKKILDAEKRCIDQLPHRLDNLEYLADGGYDQITEEYELARLVLVEKPLVDGLGAPILDGKGKPIIAKQQAFPEAGPDDMVLVKRVRSVAAPDRAAAIYLTDRAMGKPVQRQELTGEDGDAIKVALTDDERSRRIAAILDRARARRTGSTPDEFGADGVSV